jgi:hypothetical protein
VSVCGFRHSFDTSSGQNALAEKRVTPLWRRYRPNDAGWDHWLLASETGKQDKSVMKRAREISVKSTSLSADLRLPAEECVSNGGALTTALTTMQSQSELSVCGRSGYTLTSQGGEFAKR